ncbi:MAG TPA: hypothetical protein VM118_05770, partial [Acidobacteriota bacterium]|nr:hypothetical protein [Acidobacteriota bacterium]
QRRPPPRLVAIMGIDGSGKSTLSRTVAERLSHVGLVARIGDQIELLRDGEQLPMQMFVAERLREMIGRQAKTAASLKLYKIPKLAELLLRNHLASEIARWYAPVYIVTDGSPLLNILAWSVLYKGSLLDSTACAKAMAVLSGRWREVGRRDPVFAQFPELAFFERLKLGRLTLPRAAVFLDVEPEIACGRILDRGEPTQVHETPESLSRLRDSYRLVLEAAEQHRQVPVCRIAGTASVAAIAVEAVRFIQETVPAGDGA